MCTGKIHRTSMFPVSAHTVQKVLKCIDKSIMGQERFYRIWNVILGGYMVLNQSVTAGIPVVSHCTRSAP